MAKIPLEKSSEEKIHSSQFFFAQFLRYFELLLISVNVIFKISLHSKQIFKFNWV